MSPHQSSLAAPTVLAYEDRHFTLARLSGLADGLAASLTDRGVVAGGRVALMASNRPEFVVALHAVWRLAAVVVLISPAWRRHEVEHALALTEPSHAIGDHEVLSELLPMLDLDEPISPGEPVSGSRPSAEADAVLAFSSGTTGLPKAVRHTHKSLQSAVRHWRGALKLTDRDRIQIATPPSHILGLLNIMTALQAGMWMRLHRRFDIDRVLTHIEDDRITVEMAVAPIALAIACNPIDGAKLDSVGRPVQGVDVRVTSLQTGEPLGPGEVGEIQARSESLMAGYLPSEATRDVLCDGWYRTGDVGYLDAGGWLRITDRTKEMIKVRGFQVAPAEVEAVLHGHPAVADCAVFGIPDGADGESVVAAVATRRPVEAAELTALVGERLASYKRLSRVEFVPEIPRLPSGKVLRRVLKERYGCPPDS